jgi:hypothetical protein
MRPFFGQGDFLFVSPWRIGSIELRAYNRVKLETAWMDMAPGEKR